MSSDPRDWYPLDRRTRVYRMRGPEVPGGEETVTRLTVRRQEDGGAVFADVEETSPRERRVFPVKVDAAAALEDGRRVLAAPASRGTSWEDGPDDFAVDAEAVAVTVPAGTFEGCLQVTYTNEDTGGGVLWLHPEAGLVKQEQYGERGPFLFELQSLGPGA